MEVLVGLILAAVVVVLLLRPVFAGGEIRPVVVDVEIPGQPPFELTTQATIPKNLVDAVLPGATLVIRVAASKRSIEVIGPAVLLPMIVNRPTLPPGSTST
jgi:hypothetical protein